MTDAAIPTSTTGGGSPSGGGSFRGRPRGRTFGAIVLSRAWAQRGLRIGVVWVLVVVALATLAPFLANTHPIVMRAADGTLSSPMARHLTASDIALPAALLAGVVVMLTPWTLVRRVLAVVGVGGAVFVVGSLFLSSPTLVNWDQYRDGLADGSIQWAVHAPIPYSPTDRLRDRGDTRYLSPSGTHWLGTDRNGSDMASGMIHASRIALAVGLIATSLSLVIGVFIGGLMGYFVGWVDLFGMRLLEIFSAIPVLYLLLTFAAFFPGDLELGGGLSVPRVYVMMGIIGLTGWVGYARFVRAEFFKLRKMDYVASAKAAGVSTMAILFRHMLPNGVAPVLVEASFGVASAILAEAFLSFLGLGLVDQPSWGLLLRQALSDTGRFYWWIAMVPGLAIFLTVLALNLMGEALRDAVDPRTT
ncbi:MAG: ABC transporter permease [Planctomycetota bacterium]